MEEDLPLPPDLAEASFAKEREEMKESSFTWPETFSKETGQKEKIPNQASPTTLASAEKKAEAKHEPSMTHDALKPRNQTTTQQEKSEKSEYWTKMKSSCQNEQGPKE